MGSLEFLRIWSHIVYELVFLQDQAPAEFYGQVVNPISSSVYSQNTCCAALVFATEYKRSGKKEWLLRAHAALDSLAKIDVYSGLDEPKWDRLGWHNNKGSLFTSGTFLDVLWKTFDLLDLEDDKENLPRLLYYLSTCEITPGLFAHDSVKQGQRVFAVQNTTAIALYLMEKIVTKIDASEGTILNDRDLALRLLLRGQRIDGFWPYIYPGMLQQFVFRFPIIRPFVGHLPIVRRFFYKGGDASIFFGDAVHHCLTLYYLLKSIALRQPTNSCMQAITHGWAWIQEHLVKTQEGDLRFDFDWEPTPRGFRYCNFHDTSTYFLILAMLPLLVNAGIIEDNYKTISLGLLTHIENNLLEKKGIYPSIKPYEGHHEIIRFILPRVGEASAWKGALLAEFLLNQNEY